jgi:uncharacterized membrane protein YbaN (DUF454 family)
MNNTETRKDYYERQLSELRKARDLAIAAKSRAIQMLETDVRSATYAIQMADHNLMLAFDLIKLVCATASDEGIILN